MTFRLVPNLVTLNDLERLNNRQVFVISPNLVPFGENYVKVVEDTPILSAEEMYLRECILAMYQLWRYLQGNHPYRDGHET